tara:strand:+ start:1552 stop:1968 length:417 start_codon:yes stop_codon:yes gene_type:complete
LSRVLGIDFGSVRVGLALSDLTKTIANPYKTLKYQKIDNLIDQLSSIASENEVSTIVVGVPYNMSGLETKQTQTVMNFIDLLNQKFEYKIRTIDERLSSVEAEKTLRAMNIKTGHNKSDIDKIAASVILQEYLDSNYE